MHRFNENQIHRNARTCLTQPDYHTSINWTTIIVRIVFTFGFNYSFKKVYSHEKIICFFSAMLIGSVLFRAQPVKIDEQLFGLSVQFPHAQKVVWQESKMLYIVSFVEDGIRVRVVYLRNGTCNTLYPLLSGRKSSARY